MVRTAFIVIRSPRELDPVGTVSRFASKEDASMILFEDGVYNALRVDRAERLADAAENIFVARDDLEARGFKGSDLKIGKAVEYDEIVETIMERTDRTVTI